jgi:membrane-bound metal-dependent hydrolase YbcI (DUF457 family)
MATPRIRAVQDLGFTWHNAKVLRVGTVNGVACHHTHVAVGLLTGVAVASFAGLSAGGTVLFAMTGAGAALLPDLDTSDSAVSHAAGRLLSCPLVLYRKLVRRHRGVTHTLAACLVFAFGVFLLGYVAPVAEQYLPARWPLRIVVPVLLAVLATRSLMTFGAGDTIRPLLTRRHRFVVGVLVAGAVGYLGATLGPTPHFALAVAIAAGAGYFSHLVADMLMGGVPLLWPLASSLSQRVTLGHFKTAGGFDHFLGWLCLAGAVAILVAGKGGQVDQLVHHLPS